MPTILDSGTVVVSNADVLHWVRCKRAQHIRDDAEDKAAGRSKAQRPANFMRSLRKHEQELSDAKHPYTANPGAYEGNNRVRAISVFVERCDEELLYPLEEQYRQKGLSLQDLRAALREEHEKKTFTEAELIEIQNLAPENVSMLELMLEAWQERFTMEEMEKIVEVVREVFYCGEKLPAVQSDKVTNGKKRP